MANQLCRMAKQTWKWLGHNYDQLPEKIIFLKLCKPLTAKGSACSQVMGTPHVAFLSCRDSGTMKTMNMRLKTVIMVARSTTCSCPLVLERSMMYVPRAGLMTRLAAKVAET